MIEAPPPRRTGPPSWPMQLVLLYAGALAIALAFLWFGHLRAGPAALEADEHEYYDIASTLLSGHAELNARRTFGFPLALAAVRMMSANFIVLQIVVTALYALSIPLVALLVRRIGGGERAAVVAGAALALWPPAVYYGTSLYSETLALPVFLAALVLLPPGRRLGPAGRYAAAMALAAGLLLGIATQIRPMYLLFTPFVALVALVEEPAFRRAVGRAALVALGFALPILPWSATMSARFGHPILVTANGGETLSGGLNAVLLRPEGTGTAATPGRPSWYGPGKWLPPHMAGYLSPAERLLPYDRQDALLRARTIAWIEAHPGGAARLELAKVGYMWGIYGATKNGAGQFVFGNVPTLALVLVTLVLLATTRGAWTLARLWSVPLFVTGVALISWGSWRFRQPADAALLALCAICLVRRRDARDGAQPSAATPGSAR